MDTKKINKCTLLTSAFIFLVSIIGLILLGLPYLNVSVKYLDGLMKSNTYNGYQLIFDQSIISACFEPLLHFMGFIFFLAGSLIFLGIELNNMFGKKKVSLEVKTSSNKKTLTIFQVVCTVALIAIAVLLIIYGFLVSPTQSSSDVYGIGASKTVNAFLLAFNFLALTASLNLSLDSLKKSNGDVDNNNDNNLVNNN